MSTDYLSRVLQLLLQPLQGGFSRGTMTVRSSAQAELPAGAVLCPVIGGAECEAACVKVEPNPSVQGGAWTVQPSGTVVPITSIQGGAHVNLDSGTALRFDSPATAILPVATVASAMTGGTRSERFGAVRQVRVFKELGNAMDQKAFFGAQLGDYPAAVLTWAATTPGDGAVSPSLGGDATRIGNGKRVYCHEWQLFIVSSRLESTDKRRREGDVIRDNVLRILTDRSAYRGVTLSSPNGIKVIDARSVSANERAYVDAVRFTTWFVLRKTEEREFNDWLNSSLTVPPGNQVSDVRFAMPR